MDYEALLRKYIAHVRESEGVDFINNGTWYGRKVGDEYVPKHIEPAEWAELRRIADALDEEAKRT